jgi:endoglucanase
MLKALSGVAGYLHANSVPPSKVKSDGSVEDPKSSPGFSGALLPFLSALGEAALLEQQMSRVRSQFDSKTGLYGNPAKYYDQNLLLFALGSTEHRFWFDSQGALKTSWKRD